MTTRAAQALAEQLGSLGTTERAVGQAAYLKSTDHHVGVTVPDVRRVAKAWLRTARPTHEQLLALADALWEHRTGGRPVYECRLLAVELLAGSPRLLTAADLQFIEGRLRECGTWALVDPLAGWVVGRIVETEPVQALPVLDRWVGDTDFWVRRSAVLALSRSLAAGRERERFYGYCERLLPETEFFIRKVLGWMLREEASRNPAEVEAWLRAHMQGMNLVTLREPMRKFSPTVAAELRTLYDTRR